MKDSDVILLEEPRLTLADQFYLPQVLNGLGTTMKNTSSSIGMPKINFTPVVNRGL